MEADCFGAGSQPASKAFGLQYREAGLAEAFTPLSTCLLVLRVSRVSPFCRLLLTEAPVCYR